MAAASSASSASSAAWLVTFNTPVWISEDWSLYHWVEACQFPEELTDLVVGYGAKAAHAYFRVQPRQGERRTNPAVDVRLVTTSQPVGDRQVYYYGTETRGVRHRCAILTPAAAGSSLGEQAQPERGSLDRMLQDWDEWFPGGSAAFLAVALEVLDGQALRAQEARASRRFKTNQAEESRLYDLRSRFTTLASELRKAQRRHLAPQPASDSRAGEVTQWRLGDLEVHGSPGKVAPQDPCTTCLKFQPWFEQPCDVTPANLMPVCVFVFGGVCSSAHGRS